MNELKQLLANILNSIDYAGDKDLFIQKFSSSVFTATYIKLVANLDGKDIESINSKIIASLGNPSKAIDLLKEQFRQEDIEKELRSATQSLLTEFVTGIDSKISQDQRQKLSILINAAAR